MQNIKFTSHTCLLLTGAAVKNNSTGVVEYQMEEPFQYLVWYHAVGLIWISEFILAFQQMTIAGAVVTYYFTRYRRVPSTVVPERLCAFAVVFIRSWVVWMSILCICLTEGISPRCLLLPSCLLWDVPSATTWALWPKARSSSHLLRSLVSSSSTSKASSKERWVVRSW